MDSIPTPAKRLKYSQHLAVLLLLLFSAGTVCSSAKAQPNSILIEDSASATYLAQATVKAFMIDLSPSSYHSSCGYSRPKPSVNIICKPHNTPIFNILSEWPKDTIFVQTDQPTLTLYSKCHSGVRAWQDQNQAVQATLSIYDHQGHVRLSQKSKVPNSLYRLPESFTSGTCLVELWRHTNELERSWVWVIEGASQYTRCGSF